MVSLLDTSARLALLSALAASVVSGCLCPPCPEGQGAAAPPTAAAGQSGSAAQAAPVGSGARLVIWDGEGAGAAAKSWASCDKKPECKASWESIAGVGVNGTTGLKFHGEGPGYIGGGWNLFAWYPETAGIDITPYTHMTFQVRVDSVGDTAVDPDSVRILLGCSKGKQDSADVLLKRYEKDFADGKWHAVSIPIPEFSKGKVGALFDPHTFWEFRIATWSATPRNFTFYVDQIAVEKQ